MSVNSVIDQPSHYEIDLVSDQACCPFPDLSSGQVGLPGLNLCSEQVLTP